MLVSKEDAWELLYRSLTRDHLLRFEKATLEVLGVLDPQLGLSVSERIVANLLGKVQSHSKFLRTGLADTLALLGSRNTELTDGTTGQEWASRIVRQL